MTKIHTVPIDIGCDLEPFSLPVCKHEDFHAYVNICRLSHNEGENPHTFDAEISVICAQCGERMRFRGVPHEIGFRRPNGSLFATDLRAPMEPSGDFDLDRLDAIRSGKSWEPKP